MIEKGFVRQLTATEVGTLAARIGSVRCSSCGAPVDIRKDAACTHCRAPIAILDPEAVAQALAGYRAAEARRTAPPDIALMADAILAREKARSAARRERHVTVAGDGFDAADLIVDGAEIVWKLLSH
jgi:hypothetical protein